jgi:hypothetical protein|tara:strand:+ start:91 stop:438 length:348 start_codon:yes stop_codon:yes gene_type:complete
MAEKITRILGCIVLASTLVLTQGFLAGIPLGSNDGVAVALTAAEKRERIIRRAAAKAARKAARAAEKAGEMAEEAARAAKGAAQAAREAAEAAREAAEATEKEVDGAAKEEAVKD